MRRIGWTVVAVLAAGSVLLAPEAAHACEAHAQAAAKKAETQARPQDATVAPAPADQSALEELDAVMAAKCQCGSAADCTCKKGSCECAKCKKPRRQVVDGLSTQETAPKVQEARYDASAGIFI